MTPLQAWQAGMGTALAAAGLVLLLWGLRGDPARQRRRCPRCWYDLGGLAALAGADGSPSPCPECGVAMKFERQLYRRRRYWRSISIGAMMLLLGGGGAGEVLARTGEWPRFLPTPVLRAILRLNNPPQADWLNGATATRWDRARRAWAIAEHVADPSPHRDVAVFLWNPSLAPCGMESRVAIATLIPLEFSPLAAARSHAVNLLDESPATDPARVEAMALRLLRDPSLSVRLTCHRVLRERARKRPSEAFELLASFLNDPESSARAMGARTLGGFPADRDRLIPELEKLLTDPFPEVQTAAAGAIERLKSSPRWGTGSGAP